MHQRPELDLHSAHEGANVMWRSTSCSVPPPRPNSSGARPAGSRADGPCHRTLDAPAPRVSESAQAKFGPGQVVHHLRFAYRGVIVDVDPVFQGSEEWYEKVARSRPPKDRPWYHVLVHRSHQRTYVAERHLAADDATDPIEHPLLGMYFDERRDGRYVMTRPLN
jgi:heat shock protein HspQ